MSKFNLFIKQNDKYIFNGYAYQEKSGNIRLEISTIPFKGKLFIIKEKDLFKI